MVDAAPAVSAGEQAMRVDTIAAPLREASAAGRVEARQIGIDPFVMIGASATRGRVRVLAPGGWSDWFALTGADGGPDASDPIWVGEATGFELSLPAGATAVQVHLVRATESPVAIDPAAESGAAPTVHRREAWGARPYRGTVNLNRRLVRGVVHHTVTSNDYGRDEVPAILRAIQAYHQDTRGWSDIAYNFLVDRFGRVWEGRERSYEDPVIGSASSGTNLGSVAVSFIGDAMTVAPPSVVLRSIGRTLGWKMRKHGLRPTTRNIVGHRDIGQTDCPGDALYARLRAVRNIAIAGNPPPGPFFDVPWTSPDAVAIAWAARIGLAHGYSDGTFHPLRSATRGQAVLWLWRLEGRPAGEPSGFTDVPADAPYAPAVDWGATEGIVDGAGGGTFAPDHALSRLGLIEWLWRWAGEPGDDAVAWSDAAGLIPASDVRPTNAARRAVVMRLLYRLRPFDDVPTTHPARAAVDWARFHLIVEAFDAHAFGPTLPATRGLAADWLWRFLDQPAGGLRDATPGDAPVRRHDLATWLWEAAGSPIVPTSHGYTDVPPGVDYEDAVDWVAHFQLMIGFGDGTFRPDDGLTRASLVRALFRLASRPAAWAVPPPSTVLF